MIGDRILIIAAHPDDDILGCGGIISKFSLTKKIKVIFIGEGSTARFQGPHSQEARDEIISRTKMAVDALKILNVNDVNFLNLPCSQLDTVPQIDINRIIEASIDDFKPDTIFTHSSKYLNIDHQIVNKATLIATRPLPNRKVKTLLAYEVPSSSEWNFQNPFNPNYFIELNEQQVTKKQEALSIYASEVGVFPFPRSLLGLESLARCRGMQSGYILAEAFEVLRIFE